MRPFLGRVPIRTSRSRSLGQVEFTDPWGGFHRVTVEPPPADIPPFDPTLTKEQMAIDERKAIYSRKIEAKRRECELLDANAENFKEHYEALEEDDDEVFQAYSHAIDAYNECLDKIDALGQEMNTTPIDFGTQSDYQWPPEVPEPTGRPFDPGETPYVHHPEDYPPVASVDDSWPEEVPYPPSVVPEPEPPELVEPPPPPPVTPPTTASVDWRTSGCPAGTQRLVRGGMCVSSGLVSAGLTMPSTTIPLSTQAMTTASSAYLGRVPLRVRPSGF